MKKSSIKIESKRNEKVVKSYTVCQRLNNRNSRKRQQRKQRKGNCKQNNARKFPRTEKKASLPIENVLQVPRTTDENRILHLIFAKHQREKLCSTNFERQRERGGERKQSRSLTKDHEKNDFGAIEITLETRSQHPVSPILGYSRPHV